VRQLEAVNRQLLAELARRAPLLPDRDTLAFVDIDAMQKRVYGRRKQGARFGHTKIQGKSLLVRGLNALAATICTPPGAPVIACTRLRGGNANSARGAASFAAEAVGAARAAGCGGMIIVRADSAYYPAAFCGAVRRAGARFSVTVNVDPKIAAAIAAIQEAAWTAIRYPHAIWDDQLRAWVSDAEVAEVPYTAFTSKNGQAITARLIVRRVRDQNKKTAAGQDELFPSWRYHAVFTSSPFELIQAEGQHRDHAIIEQVFADVTDGPLAHLPSGFFPANAAWLTCCDRAQPAARGRRPSQPRLRQGPRLHNPPRPHRHRRPHRPARPRPHHAAPARGLAPRTRVDEPVRRRLRPAASPGLTSSAPGHRTLNGPPAPASAPDPRTRTSRRKGKRQDRRARDHDQKRETRSPQARKLTGGSRLRSLRDPACLRPLQECTRMLTETSPGRFKGLVLTAELHEQPTTQICEFDSGK
jgi:hypothetical protein